MIAQRVPPPGRPPLEPYERVLRDLALAGDRLYFNGERFYSSKGLSDAQKGILDDYRWEVLAQLEEHGGELLDRIREEECR